jgi:hypothetical protein
MNKSYKISEIIIDKRKRPCYTYFIKLPAFIQAQKEIFMSTEKSFPDLISRDELASALEDPRIRSYLEGVFTMIRAIVGYQTSMNDFLANELQKERPDRVAINAILSENDSKMMDFLGSITDAHHLLSRTEESPGICNFSEAMQNIAAKLTMLFENTISITTDIAPNIYAQIDRISVEIAVSNLIEELITYRKPPAAIKISLAPLVRSRPKFPEATLTLSSLSPGKYKVAGLSEAAVAIRAPEFSDLFIKDFCRKLEATIKRREQSKGLEISVRLRTVKTDIPIILASESRFEFDNARFSPIATKLAKYVRRPRY